MADEALKKVISYLRQIEKLAAQGDTEGIIRETRLARRLCGDTTLESGHEGNFQGR